MYQDNYLIAALSASAEGRGREVFAEVPGQDQVTFGGLFAGAERMAAALVTQGVQPGDRVAVQVEKTSEAIQLYLGTVMAGGVVPPLTTHHTTP